MIDPSDLAAIEQVVRFTAHHNDTRDWSALAASYHVAGTLVRPSGERVTGRAAIEAAYATGPPERRTRHHCGGTVVEPIDADTAHATTSVLLFTWTHGDGGVLPDATGPAIGEFRDVLVRDGDAWLIRERVATLSARVARLG